MRVIIEHMIADIITLIPSFMGFYEIMAVDTDGLCSLHAYTLLSSLRRVRDGSTV